MQKLFKQFSFPGGIPSHVAPETPGLDPRRRRARLRAVARLRRGVRQSRSDRRLRRRRRRGGDRAARDELALQQVPEPGARRRRAADPAPERLQDRQPVLPRAHSARRAREAASRAWATGRTSSRGTSPRRCTSRWRRRSTPSSPRSSASSTRRARTASRTSDVADDRAAHAEGLDVPAEIDGKKCEDYWRSHQVPMGDMDKPEHVTHPRRLDEELPAGGALRRRRHAAPGARRARARRATPHERQPARQRRAPAARPAAARLPRRTPSTAPEPGATVAEATRVMGTFLRDVMKHNLEQQQFPPVQPRREQLEPLAGRARGHQPLLRRRDPARRRPPLAGRPRDGSAVSEHQCQGWLEGYLLTGRHGFFQLLRGVHPHHRLDVQPAREVAEGLQPHSVARADRLAQLPAQFARLAAGPQRLLAPGPGLHRSRRQQEGGGHPRLSAARRQLPAVGHRSLPAQPQLRERRRRRQAAGAACG